MTCKHIITLSLMLTMLSAMTFIAKAQHNLTYVLNSFRDGDSIVKVQIPYVDPLKELVVPDISKANSVYEQKFTQIGDTMMCAEHNTLYYYLQTKDSLTLVGFENRTSKIDYILPQFLQSWNFSLGDSVSDYFQANGCYGERIYIGIWGQNYAVADKVEELIFEDGRIEDALRIHRRFDMVREAGFEPYHTKDISKDRVIQKFRQTRDRLIEDHYLWYKAGYRYPILESVETYHIEDGKRHENFSMSFLYLPEWQVEELSEDNDNESVRLGMAAASAREEINTGEASFPVDIKAHAEKDRRKITLKYEQKEEGTIRFVVCDATARPLSVLTQRQESGNYENTLWLSGVPVGNTIIIYTELNGKISSFKIKNN